MTPHLFYFLKIALAILALFSFHVSFRIGFFYFSKQCNWSLDSALNLWVVWGSLDALTILIVPISEHRIPVHLFR